MDRTARALALILGLVGCGGGEQSQDARPAVAATCTATPRYDTVSGAPATPPAASVDVYVDASQSISGFLRPDTDTERSALEALFDETSAQLQGSTGLAGTSVRAATFGDGITWKAPVFRSTEFRKKKSDLNAVFAQIKSDIGNGNTHSAAVITDLVATGDTMGGIQAAQSLLDWAQTSTAAGSASVGMLGVKSRFWGVHDAKCKGGAKGAGCWFSEQTQLWTPLTAAVEVPLYVLIFGRSEGQVDGVSAAIRSSLGLEGDKHQWEMLVRHEAARQLGITCGYHNPDPAGPPRLRAEWGDGSLHCSGSETFDLSCTVEDGDKGLLFAEGTKASWASVTVVPSATGLTLSVNCASYKSSLPKAPLEVHGDAVAPPAADPWEKWTTASDESAEALGRTLRLAEFAELVRSRPPAYDITCGPLFKVAP